MSQASASTLYQKKSEKERILLRPDSYVGSIKPTEKDEWVYDMENEKMIRKILNYPEGLGKIFDEVLVNAIDQSVREHVTQIKVDINRDTGVITILNNGPGIPIVKHKVHKVLIPTMIFFELGTSSNYDDSVDRITGGRNGLGAKLTNIFSLEFTVETVDTVRKLKFKQSSYNNLSEVSKPKITKFNGNPYTKITFLPDYQRFRMTGLDDDTYAVLERRVYDTTACTQDRVNVYLNGVRLTNKSFERYIDYYVGNKRVTKRVYIQLPNQNNNCPMDLEWEVCVCLSDSGEFQHMSFVNGIATTRGGTHVEYIATKIAKQLGDYIRGKKKNVRIENSFVKRHLWLFLQATVINPEFSSQTKEELKSKISDSKYRCIIPDKFIRDAAKCDIEDRVVQFSEFRTKIDMTKTDGKKKKRLTGIDKLEDATDAGTDASDDCTLILTEGDSAKTLAMAGLAVIGTVKYGVFPLKGKFINVKQHAETKVMTNEEFINLKEILGLEQGAVYENTKSLRYGHVMVFTDADTDGSHIKGLVMNVFHEYWPSLLKLHEFIVGFITPVVKVRKGRGKSQVTIKEFYVQSKFDEWRKHNNLSGLDVKYYKGLATHKSTEAREYFTDYDKHLVTYSWGNDQECDDIFQLVFSKAKNMADKRKIWLGEYDKTQVIPQNQKVVSYPEFFDKDMKHFSVDDNSRSIPCMCDGLKTSQRKILWACFKRGLTYNKKEIKVEQLTGYVTEHSDYHHGGKSIVGTIINLAQNYVGTNNINLLEPEGQFGSRIENGGDAGSERYIYTRLSEITPLIFNPKDSPLLEYCLDDENMPVEPEWYAPCLPMILINGCCGIGTGYSTTILPYHPLDIIDALKAVMSGNNIEPLHPFFRGFIGELCQENDTTYVTYGICERVNRRRLKIVELPVGPKCMSFIKYKQFLETHRVGYKPKKGKGPKKLPNQFIKDYECKYNDVLLTECWVDFVDTTILDYWLESGEIFGKLRLSNKFSITNMHAFNEKKQIRKFDTPEEILRYWLNNIRIPKYVERKEYQLKKEEKVKDIIHWKIKFLEGIHDGTIMLTKNGKPLSKVTLRQQLEENKFPQFDTKTVISNPNPSYNYLTDMKISKLTEEELSKLRQKLTDKLNEISNLESMTVGQLYTNDLDVIEKVYENLESEWKHSFDTLCEQKAPTKKTRRKRKKE